MKNVKVEIHNNHTLKLLEDANAGDLIDLNQVTTINQEIILNKINEAKDLVYKELLSREKNTLKRELELEKENMKTVLSSEIESLKKALESKEREVVSKLALEHTNELNKFKEELVKVQNINENLLNNQKLLIENKSQEVKSELLLEHERKMSALNQEIERLKFTNQTLLNNEKTTIDNLLNEHSNNLTKINLEHEVSLNQIKTNNEILIRDLNLELDNLKREKSSLNVKLIGEDLERWADSKFNENHLIQPDNIKWYKDNESVKGGKADFIYEVYSTKKELENTLLTSVILEMKSEDPHAPTKQRLDTILKKLDSDRNNKNIEYAILVSEIDFDNSDLYIERVREYDKMFIVRPQYFMTLLNVITAFSLKYEDILLAKAKDAIKFKDSDKLLKEFDEMKIDMLDNQIKHINTHLENLRKQNETIINATNKITESLNIIIEGHMKTLINKINNFNIKKIANKIDEVN